MAPKHILNPITNRWILKHGTTAKRLKMHRRRHNRMSAVEQITIEFINLKGCTRASICDKSRIINLLASMPRILKTALHNKEITRNEKKRIEKMIKRGKRRYL